jgi:uncharacterized protein
MNTRWATFMQLAAVSLLIAPLAACQSGGGQEKISEFGRYQGYSEAIYDGTSRTSDFLTLSDGTRLAYDLFLPTKKGAPSDKRLPVLFKYTPYDRAWTVIDKDGKVILCDLMPTWWCDPALRLRSFIVPLLQPGSNGRIKDQLDNTPWLADLMKHGYVVVVVDRPGTGASFGRLSLNGDVVAAEADQILEWIAGQPWCDGNIGMFGNSIQAQAQFQAASAGNPHLKAILPATTWIDNYSAVGQPGGIPNLAFGRFYKKANQTFDRMSTPLDQDEDGSLLLQARVERQNTSSLAKEVSGATPYRDSKGADGGQRWLRDHTLYPLLNKINRSGTAVYLIGGWYDMYARDDFEIYNNLTVPKRLMFRPADHSGIETAGADVNFGAEAHRWFDYWLKGIDNGIVDEPPIHYFMQGAEKAQAWQSADCWPLKDQETMNYYFGPAYGGEKRSVNDGALGPLSPTTTSASDAYQVDYTPTTGNSPLWSSPAMPHKYPNMKSHDAKGLTYTTPPLERAIKLAGHPIAHIWLSADAPDLDVFVYLEQVDNKGNSTYITEGQLRASHRAVSEAPFDDFGLPWRNHFQSELQPIHAGEPLELVFDLRPTAWQFPAGSRIRITVAFADAGNFDTPVLTPAPTVQILRDAGHASFVEMPIVTVP